MISFATCLGIGFTALVGTFVFVRLVAATQRPEPWDEERDGGL